MKFIGYRTLKTGIGSAVAMIIASKLGLQYAVSAGVITILSIQNTKRQSSKIAFQRMIACILGLLISVALFKVMGYNAITFGAFLLIFIPLTVKLKLEQGIIVSSVLVTHLLVQQSSSMFWFFNEIGLMVVGIGVALILNLYMPSIEGQIKKDQAYIELKMKEILFKMSEALKEDYDSIEANDLFKSLESKLHSAKRKAYNNLNNYFIVDMSYYVEYMDMRMQQFETMKRMRGHFQRFFMTYEQTIIISDFTRLVAESLHEENTVADILKELNDLRENFKAMALPETREEFENRAMLFQFLNDMEQFLMIKYEFKKNISNIIY